MNVPDATVAGTDIPIWVLMAGEMTVNKPDVALAVIEGLWTAAMTGLAELNILVTVALTQTAPKIETVGDTALNKPVSTVAVNDLARLPLQPAGGGEYFMVSAGGNLVAVNIPVAAAGVTVTGKVMVTAGGRGRP